jgi:hypothetical protein
MANVLLKTIQVGWTVLALSIIFFTSNVDFYEFLMKLLGLGLISVFVFGLDKTSDSQPT